MLRVVDDAVARFGKAPLLKRELAPAIASMGRTTPEVAWRAIARCLTAGWLAGGGKLFPRTTRVHPIARTCLAEDKTLWPLPRKFRGYPVGDGRVTFPVKARS